MPEKWTRVFTVQTIDRMGTVCHTIYRMDNDCRMRHRVGEGAEIVHPVVNIYRNGKSYRASEEGLFYELEYRDRFEL